MGVGLAGAARRRLRVQEGEHREHAAVILERVGLRPSFRKMFVVCFSTAPGVMKSSSPIA